MGVLLHSNSFVTQRILPPELEQAGQLGWIPLTHLRTPGFSPAEIIPSSQRRHNMTFRGNSKTNGGRRYHWKELQSHFQRRNSTMTGTVIKRSSFSTDPTNGDYLREMSNSRLCLGMKGLSPECYRFYESLECGEYSYERVGGGRQLA